MGSPATLSTQLWICLQSYIVMKSHLEKINLVIGLLLAVTRQASTTWRYYNTYLSYGSVSGLRATVIKFRALRRYY